MLGGGGSEGVDHCGDCGVDSDDGDNIHLYRPRHVELLATLLGLVRMMIVVMMLMVIVVMVMMVVMMIVIFSQKNEADGACSNSGSGLMMMIIRLMIMMVVVVVIMMMIDVYSPRFRAGGVLSHSSKACNAGSGLQ